MMWLTWRQHRAALAAGAGVLAALTAFLLATGGRLHRTYDDLGLNACAAPVSTTCPDLASRFEQLYAGYQFILPLLLLLPVLVGVFWGAPLVAREIEHGTHRLVWTQSISRGRWLTVKVAVLALAALVGLVASAWLLTWWIGPLLALGPSRFDSGMFDLLGLTPAAYGLTALALGVAAGTFSRKLIPAIGLTILAFLVVRVGVEVGLRPRYMAPETITMPMPAPPGPGAPFAGKGDPLDNAALGWILSVETMAADGRVMSDGIGFNNRTIAEACPELRASDGGPPDRVALADCVRRLDLHVEVTYQPDDRYWRFQVTEAAIYLVLSAALLGASGWWLRHRVA